MQERLHTEDGVSSHFNVKGDLTGSCVGWKLVRELLNSVKGAVQRTIENTYCMCPLHLVFFTNLVICLVLV